MRHLLAIAGRELRSLFSTPTAYILLAVYLVFAGFIFSGSLRVFLQRLEQIQAIPQYAHLLPVYSNLNEYVISASLEAFILIFVALMPLLSMRAFSDERANGTIELLLTCPVTTWEIVLGKYLAILAMVGLFVGAAGAFSMMLFVYGNPEVLWALAPHVGLLFLGASLAALGCFISALTRSQIVAAIVGFVAGLLLFLLDFLGGAIQNEILAAPIQYLAISPHLGPMLRGLIRLQDVAYFLIMILFFLTLSRMALESLRWR